MNRLRLILVPFIIIILAFTACAVKEASTPEPQKIAEIPTIESGDVAKGIENFRFLISDDRNAIEDFEHLTISITSIGLLGGGESGNWITENVSIDPVDLVPLQGANAQQIWSGTIPEGHYSKVFIYVDVVCGTLIDPLADTPVREEPQVNCSEGSFGIKLPSKKLQIIKQFDVYPDSEATFVYDVTVVAAGNDKSGIKYLLKPVVNQSGADIPFVEVDATAPEIIVAGVTDGQQSSETLTITYSATDDTDPDPSVSATLNGETFASGSEVSEIGQYELVVTAEDASDNQSEVIIGFEIVEPDITAPEITVEGVTDGQQSSEALTITYSATDDTDPDPSVSATLNGETFASGSEVSEIGQYELVVTVEDASGNQSEVIIGFEIVES